MVVSPSGPEIFSVLELTERVKANQRLISAARPTLAWLAQAVGEGFSVGLCDRGMLLLDVAASGSKPPPGLKRGASWDWQHVGATALGPALSWKRPWLMRGWEHEWARLRDWASVAAPIADPEGEPVGLLLALAEDTAVHPHTAVMLGAAAQAVATELKGAHSSTQLQTVLKYQAAIVESVSDGLLTIDADGVVTYMNPAGARILGLDPKEAVGRPIQSLVGFKPVVLDVLRTGEGYTDREFILRDSVRSFHFIKTAIAIRDESGKITGVVDTFREIHKVRQMVNRLTGAQARFTFDDFIGQSPVLQECIGLARVAARSSSNVLIIGESGTGKELLAQAIHNASAFADGPFVAVNCAAIPRDLIEGELFGAEEGAFTGAPKGGRPGKFELANGGTIFLDEIGDMPLEMQVKLLRVLQERRVTRLGGKHEMEIKCRVIAATNHDLIQDVREGHFRRDLYYRLNVLQLLVPPLVQRLDDLPLLVQRLTDRLSRRLGKEPMTLSAEAMAALYRHNWPGNVRELENVLERAINVAEGEQILAQHLHLKTAAVPQLIYEAPGTRTIDELQQDAVRSAVEACEGNITRAARMLGCSRNTVYAKLRQAHQNPPSLFKN